MLKIQNRLKKRKEFAYIYRKGERFHTTNITLYKIASKYPNPKIGFSVNNKVGKAVVRNKVKRRLREIVKEFLPSISKCNLIFVVKPSIIELDFEQMKSEVKQILTKGKILDE